MAELCSSVCFTFHRIAKMFFKLVLHFHSHKPCVRVPVEPHPQEHLGVIALNFSFCSGCTWYFAVVFTWISLPINDFEHFSMCFLVSHILLGIVSVQNFCPHEKLDCLSYGWIERVLYILNTNSLSDICLTTIFSQL